MAFLEFVMQEGTVPAEAVDSNLTILDLAIKGGWVMIPIILLSFVAAYIFIERFYVIRKSNERRFKFHEQDKRLYS